MLFDLLTHILDIALPIILGYLIWVLKEERTERKANTLGLKEILGYMIDRWYSEIMLQGYITTDQRNTIEGVYKAYSANKGNGARKAKWEEIKKVKIDDTKPNVSIYFDLAKEKFQRDHCPEKEDIKKDDTKKDNEK